jgi:hypothetical protein
MRHGIDLKPIHNVKDGDRCRLAAEADLVFSSWSVLRRRALLRQSYGGMVERIGIEPMTSSLQS